MKLIEIIHRSQISLKGTIIDLETTHYDVSEGEIVTCGVLDARKINIFQRLSSDHTSFKTKILELSEKFERPFYAFNRTFEEDFLEIEIDEELQSENESAFTALMNEGLIEKYNRLADPLQNDEIGRFWDAWKLTGDPVLPIKITRHNYCCLAKELFIKLRRFDSLEVEDMPYFPTSGSLKKIWRKGIGF